jgi:hypothetical protein
MGRGSLELGPIPKGEPYWVRDVLDAHLHPLGANLDLPKANGSPKVVKI